MSGIFISYRCADSQSAAGKLALRILHAEDRHIDAILKVSRVLGESKAWPTHFIAI